MGTHSAQSETRSAEAGLLRRAQRVNKFTAMAVVAVRMNTPVGLTQAPEGGGRLLSLKAHDRMLERIDVTALVLSLAEFDAHWDSMMMERQLREISKDKDLTLAYGEVVTLSKKSVAEGRERREAQAAQAPAASSWPLGLVR